MKQINKDTVGKWVFMVMLTLMFVMSLLSCSRHTTAITDHTSSIVVKDSMVTSDSSVIRNTVIEKIIVRDSVLIRDSVVIIKDYSTGKVVTTEKYRETKKNRDKEKELYEQNDSVKHQVDVTSNKSDSISQSTQISTKRHYPTQSLVLSAIGIFVIVICVLKCKSF